MFHSYVITHPSKIKLKEYRKQFLSDYKIQDIDILSLIGESTIGIGEIKGVLHFLSQKPFSSPHKAVIIAGDILTIEAQQALLKTLEEPPEYAFLMIETTQEDLLLPTILSRSKIVRIPIETIETDEKNHAVYWQKIVSERLGERLIRTPELTKDREQVRKWLKEQIMYIRKKLLTCYEINEQEPVFYITILKRLIITNKHIEGNISLKLAVDHLLLNLPYENVKLKNQNVK